MVCKDCPLKDDMCVQNLGESVGWQWWKRTDESFRDCHFNYTEGKTHDPYLQHRKKNESSTS